MRPIDFFDEAVDSFEQRVALIDRGVTLTFGALARVSKQIANVLDAVHGDSRPRPVGIWSPNDYRCVAGTLGVMRAGGIIMPLHSHASAEKVAQFVNALEPDVVFFHTALQDRLPALQRVVRHTVRWICLDGDCAGAETLEHLMSSAGDQHVDRWGDAYGNPGRPAFVRQTSGTTGEPRTLVGNIASFAVSHVALQRHLAHSDSPVALVATPFSHAAGLHAFAILAIGGTLVLRPEFETTDVLRSIQEHRVTHMWLPVSALHLMLAHPALHEFDYGSLKQILLGASAPSPDRLRDAVAAFGPCMAVHYGQSEGGFLTWLDERTVADAAAGHHAERLASSGTTMHVARVSIMDEHGNHVPRGEVGEIVARGASVKPFIRRLGVEDDAEMATAQQYGWHHTGDLGYLDAAGYLYVVGRKKDMIISGGFKVPVAEVERTIMELPAVAECAVIGVPDSQRGEAVKAIVTIRPGHTLSIPALLAHCRSRIGRVNSPVTIEEWAELPRTSVGKIDKRGIRQQFWAGASREIN